ncbi:MAG: lipase maturation factor family protein [Actinomycetota bacterium]|nr:lipase maturation factor family protein [Actinomycetota bacterium]
MEWFSAPEYWLSRLVFQRLMGAIYLVAFLSTANQFRPLLGADGLLPVPRYLAAVSFRQAPSIFHWHYSDRFALGLAWAGSALAAAVVLGLPEQGPLWVSMTVWFALWALYLSFVNVGQTFYGFIWETLLLEAGFLAIFLGNARTAPPVLTIWLIRWLLVRLEVGAGLIKLRHDRSWRDLTALYYHHETQPIPNRLSWYFHHLPKPVHKAEVVANHVSQLILPLALLLPQPVAGTAGALVVTTQLWLLLSGNFAWLNVLTIALAVPTFHDGMLGRVLPLEAPALEAPSGWFVVVVVALTAAVVVLSYWPVRNMASPKQLMNCSYNPLRLVNTYGLFGSITRERHEVVIEGTDEATPGGEVTWEEYQFKAKPGDPRRRPRQVAPYHLRLDWLMWFAPLSPRYAEGWFLALVAKLLQNDEATLRLLSRNPFPEAPPKLVRARLYRYRYTTRAERRQSGAVWVRQLVDEYLPPVGLGRRSPTDTSADPSSRVA